MLVLRDRGSFEIWLVDDFLVLMERENRIFTITDPRLKQNLGKNYELIMEGEDGMLCLYNLFTKEIKNLHVDVYHGDAFSNKSSLVSVSRGNKLDIGDYLSTKQTGCRM